MAKRVKDLDPGEVPTIPGWYQRQEWFRRSMYIKKVLFVCSGNSGRSPAAEYFFKKMTSWTTGMTAFSRGVNVTKITTAARIPFIPFDVEEARILAGMDRKARNAFQRLIKRHKSKQVSAEDVEKADLILALETGIRNQLKKEFPDTAYKTFTLKEFANQGKGNINIPDIFVLFDKRPDPGLKAMKKPTTARGKLWYHLYLQKTARLLMQIESLVRKVVFTLILVNRFYKERKV